MATGVRNLTLDESSEKVYWSKVRQVVVMAGDSSAIHIKTCYTGQTQRLDMNRRKRVSGGSVDVCQVKLQKGILKPGITELNKQNLVALCNSSQTPTSYRAFYESLSVGGKTEDSADEA